jgi:HK97 family phage portal protein
MSLRERIHAFLNPLETKVNPAYQGLITYDNSPKPVSMPRNYKSYANEGYRGDDTVYKCISYIARNGAAIPPVLYTDSTKEKRIEKHPLLDLLNKPNEEQTGVQYRESILGYKLLAGNSYQYAVTGNKNAPPAELWVLRPDLVQIMPTKTRGIAGYKYEYFDNPILPQQIAHSKYWHPDNDLYGLSPLEIAAVLVDQQKAAKLWNLALLQNSARPPGAWIVPTALSKNDRDRLQAALREKMQGYRNAGTPPILDAGLQWQSMALSPESLDWLEGIQYNAAMIANIYSIPPQLIGDNSASTYNNVQEAKAASYTEAIFPELDDLYAILTNWLLPKYPDLKNACLYYDKESVEVVQSVIQDQKNAQAERSSTMWMNGQCTLNESRVLSGLPEVPEGDVYRIGMVLVPADKLQEYAEQSLTTPAAPPAPVAEPVDENAQPQGSNTNDTNNDNNKPTPPAKDPQKPGSKPANPTTGADGKGNPHAPDEKVLPAREHDLSEFRRYTRAIDVMTQNKEMDKHGIYQPDDLDKQLKALKDKGVTRITWDADINPCDTCSINNTQIVELGQPFYSGHILPPAHPNCECQVTPVD